MMIMTMHTYSYLIIIIILITISQFGQSGKTGKCACNVTLSTLSIRDYEWKEISIDLNASCTDCHRTLNLKIDEESLASIQNHSLKLTEPDCYLQRNLSLKLKKFGKTYLRFYDDTCDYDKIEIIVLKKKPILGHVFLAILVLLLVLTNMGMGLKIKLQLLLKLVKNPAAPLIGMIWQFVIMAPLSFGLAKGLQLESIFAIGLFAIGCSPGGGSGNLFAILLDGDMELALMMNLTGLIASLATAPIWISVLIPYIETFETTKITIEVSSVFVSLAVVLIPVAIGMAITLCQPKIGKFLQKALKPCLIIVGLAFFGLGVAVYYFAITLFDWRIYVATFLFPFIGYTTSGLAAYFFNSGRERAITVSCMVGFQNVGLAILMLRLSLHSPLDDIGGAVPILYIIMGGSLPFIVIMIRQTRIHLEQRKKQIDRVDDDQNNVELTEKLRETVKTENQETET